MVRDRADPTEAARVFVGDEPVGPGRAPFGQHADQILEPAGDEVVDDPDPDPGAQRLELGHRARAFEAGRRASAHAHGQFDVVGERDGQVAAGRRAHSLEIFGAPVGVVGDHQGARPQAALEETENLRIERLGAIEQNKIDRLGEVRAQRLERVSLANLDQVVEAGGRQIGPRPRRLRGLELARDEAPAAIVLERRGQVERRDSNDAPNSTIDRAPVLRASM